MRPAVSRIRTPAPPRLPRPVPQEEPPTLAPPPAPRTHRLLAVEEAGEYLGVSRATVERLAYRGQLPIVKIGGATR